MRAFIVLAWLAASAAARIAIADESSFTPRLAVGFDIFVQDVAGSFESNDVPSPSGTTRTAITGGDSTVATPTATFDGMLLAPGLRQPAYGIRPFVRAGGQIATKPNRMIHRDDLREAQNQLEVEVPWLWSAGVGLEFSVPAYDTVIFIRPSMEYFGERVRYEANVLLAEQTDPQIFSSLVNVFKVSHSQATIYHAMGPRFDIEGVIATIGPVSVGFYGEARFAWLMGDREVDFIAANEIGSGAGSFQFRASEQFAQGGAGIRLTWNLGE